MMRKQKDNVNGFTLIELLVVIAIIALLAAIVATALSYARAKARDTKRISDVHQISKALEIYYSVNGLYPISTLPSNNNIPGLTPNFVASIPAPPTPPDGDCTVAKNNYTYQSDGKTYGLSYCLGRQTGEYPPNYYMITPDGNGLKYDVNGDGVFDSNDPNYIAQYVVHLQSICPIAKCDISGDGTVSSYDAALLSIILSGS